MANQTPAEAAVARGMALLDAKVPGWEDRIDLGRLDLTSPQDCICGQLFGWFSRGLEALSSSGRGGGFVAPVGASWTETEIAWRAAILARRAARQEPPNV